MLFTTCSAIKLTHISIKINDSLLTPQAAINAAFADDGELLFVGNDASATPMYNGDAVQVSVEG